MKREAASIRCPECGGETREGSSNFLLWCDDSGEKPHILLCEACGYIFMSGKEMQYVKRGRCHGGDEYD